MKKLIVILFVVVFVSFGCGNNENNGKDAEAKAKPEAKADDVNKETKTEASDKGLDVNENLLFSKLAKDIFEIAESWDNDAYEIGDKEYKPEELLAALNKIDKDKFQYGILKHGVKLDKKDTCWPILEQFCIDNNIDLFTKGAISKYVPPEEDFVGWAVKSTRTIYEK